MTSAVERVADEVWSELEDDYVELWAIPWHQLDGDFTPSDRPAEDVLREWRELGRDPHMGELGWLDLPR